MPPSSAAARSLALVVIGVGMVSFAAHGQNAVAFEPYSGAGLQGGPLPQCTLHQVEVRTIADKADPDSRKVSLARALVVRNYLIDKGVRARIEIVSIVGDGGERVEILVLNT